MEISRDAGSIPAASIRLAALAHGRPFDKDAKPCGESTSRHIESNVLSDQRESTGYVVAGRLQ
jgi:hypothetical protein